MVLQPDCQEQNKAKPHCQCSQQNWSIKAAPLSQLYQLKRKTRQILSGTTHPLKGPRKVVLGYKIAPNRFKTTYRSVLTFEEKKESITHLFKTFSGLRLDCDAFILAKWSENTVCWTFHNQRHFECEIPRELFLSYRSTVGQWRHKQASSQTWKS